MPCSKSCRNRHSKTTVSPLLKTGSGGKKKGWIQMRKLLALLLCVCLALGMVPAIAEGATEAEAAPQVMTKNFRVYYGTTTEVWREDFPVYFVDGVEDLPFMNMEDWKDLLVYAYNRVDTNGDKEYGLEMEVSEDGKSVTLTRDTGYPMKVDFEDGTMKFLDYVAFVQLPNAKYMDFSGAPETMNGEPFLLQYTQSRNLYGDITIVNLKENNIPMVALDGKYLLPMQTLAAFTLSDIGVGVYFNGQALYLNSIQAMSDPLDALQTNLALAGLLTADVVAQYQAHEGTAEEKLDFLLELVSATEQGKKIAEDYKKSKETSLYLDYTSAPKVPRSDALIQYSTQELAMELDYLYGLKESHNITDFRTFFLQNEVGAGLLDPDAAKADQAVADMTNYWFDDGHSGFVSSSYLSGSEAQKNFGFDVASATALQQRLATLRAQYPHAGDPYYEVGDTAYVTFDQFAASTDGEQLADYYKMAEEGNVPTAADTIGIIYYAHQQITRENSPIKNVVLDLSVNNGGMAVTALYTLGWYLGDANFSYRNTFTGAQTTRYFRADVNLDHQFDENDTLAGRGLNLYCLISPRSFSCGNLVPWVLKSSGEVTLLGKTSGGGSCVVGFNTTAWGASYQYSSPKRLAFVKNGSYYDVDKGVEPDHVIDSYANFYDRDALTEFIHGLY